MDHRLKLLQLLQDLLLQRHVGHHEVRQAEDWPKLARFHARTLQVDLVEATRRVQRVPENILAQVDQQGLLVAELAVEFAELADLREALDLLLTLLRVQILLHLGPLFEHFLLLDLSEIVIHACEGLEEEAESATRFEVCRLRGLWIVAEVSHFLQGHELGVVIYLATDVDQFTLELAEIGEGRLIFVLSLIYEATGLRPESVLAGAISFFLRVQGPIC